MIQVCRKVGILKQSFFFAAGNSVAGNGENGVEGDKGKTKQAEAHRTGE